MWRALPIWYLACLWVVFSAPVSIFICLDGITPTSIWEVILTSIWTSLSVKLTPNMLCTSIWKHYPFTSIFFPSVGHALCRRCGLWASVLHFIILQQNSLRFIWSNHSMVWAIWLYNITTGIIFHFYVTSIDSVVSRYLVHSLHIWKCKISDVHHLKKYDVRSIYDTVPTYAALATVTGF